jgi:hypothetical protein
MTVRLYVCDAAMDSMVKGQGNFSQRLSDALGTKVIAAGEYVWYDLTTSTRPSPIANIQLYGHRIPDPFAWKAFTPSGGRP